MLNLKTYNDVLFRIDEVLQDKFKQYFIHNKRFFYDADEKNLSPLLNMFDIDTNINPDYETLIKAPLQTYFFEGTDKTLEKALSGLSQNIELEQWHKYNGEPYHFKVKLLLDETKDQSLIAKQSNTIIEKFKNVRSVCDGVELNNANFITTVPAIASFTTVVISAKIE